MTELYPSMAAHTWLRAVIATAGIERHVILHSPTPNAPWATDLPPTLTSTRPLPSGGPAPSDPSVLRLLMRLSSIMEVDESMGEDARSIAYFDLCVSVLVFVTVLCVLMRVDVYARRCMCTGFCNVRVLETYFHTDDRRCHLTRMLMTAMMWNLLARVRMTKMTGRAQANPDLPVLFLIIYPRAQGDTDLVDVL
jgi:hypothetical protein